jgi:hypothetical protein
MPLISVNIGLDALDLALEAGDQLFQVRCGDLSAGGAQAIVMGGALIDQIAPRAHQGLEPGALPVGDTPAPEMPVPLGAVAGQRPGVDAVALAQRARRPDEGLHLTGVGAVSGHPGGSQGFEQGRLMAAGGFAQGEAVPVQGSGEGGERPPFILDLDGLGSGAVEDDDMALADIAADEARGRAIGGLLGHFALSSGWLGIVCGRASPFNSSSVPSNADREPR